MKKLRSDALWNELTPEQLEKLDTWLFEENRSYSEILSRAQSELGFKGSDGSLRRYYQRRKQERAVENLEELAADAAEVKGLAGDADTLRTAAMKMVAAQAFQQVREAPEEVEKWGPTVKLMVENDRNETVREGHRIRQKLREEDQEIRWAAIEFTRDKFQYDMVERAVRALPQLLKLAEAMNDPNPKRYQDNPHWQEAREKMFKPEADKADTNA